MSTNLIHWEHLPPALVPTPGWLDADGCFSGCCVINSAGEPIILYTGVRLRSNTEAGPLPPQEHDLGMVWIESQCIAVLEDPEDEMMISWKKLEQPFLPLPPCDLQLTGWRDPYVFTPAPPRDDSFEVEHSMLIGSGIKGRGGTALLYRSNSITNGWELVGQLCTAPTTETGVVWECPLLVPLAVVSEKLKSKHPGRAPRWLFETTTVETPVTKSPLLTGRALSHRATLSSSITSMPSIAARLKALAGREKGETSVPASAAQSPRARPSQDGRRQSTDSEFAALLPVGTPLAKRSSSAFEFISPLTSKGNLEDVEMWPSQQTSVKSERTSPGETKANTPLEDLMRSFTLEQWVDGPPVEVQAVSRKSSNVVVPGTTTNNEDDDATKNNAKSSMAIPEEDFGLSFQRHRLPSIKAKVPANGGMISPMLSSQYLDELDQLQQHTHKKWHFFTVSPDAPTNPVLYWVGHLADGSDTEFDLGNAKGPFRLDLGDILYAPNVCQDDKGRWLLWGWLQERRKVGSYSYAGCLSLPRVLTVTDEGTLIQAPLKELNELRRGKGFHLYRVPLTAHTVVPLDMVGGYRLDIEISIHRHTASAAGILFRSHDAEAEGGTAILYDWNTGLLEAVFNVPPNWVPDRHQTGGGDDSTLPRSNNSEDLGGMFHLEDTSPMPSPLLQPTSAAGAIGGTVPPSPPSPRSPLFKGGSTLLGTSLTTPTKQPGLLLSTSFPQIRGGGGGDSGGPSTPREGGNDDLEHLLDELAAPMMAEAEASAAMEKQEPRRVGGPLSMSQLENLHLRVIVDHSCVEVYTGSGEVLSTRVYRGIGYAQNPCDPGIDFIAFNGTAVLERVSAWEMGSAWRGVEEHEVELRARATAPVSMPGTSRPLSRIPSSSGLSRSISFAQNFVGGPLEAMDPGVLEAKLDDLLMVMASPQTSEGVAISV